MPPVWGARLSAHAVSTSGDTGFTVDAVQGDTAFGEYLSASGNGIGALDLVTGHLVRLAKLPADAAGIAGMAADSRWLVWSQLDSQANESVWSLHAWNRATGVSTRLADSHLPGGRYVAGQPPIPVLRQGFAAWAQPVPGRNQGIEANLRVLNLDTRHAVTLASGRLSSPVYAGRYLVWATVSDAGWYRLDVADAATLRPSPLPGRPPRPDSIGYLGGSASYLVWSTKDYTGLTVWPIGSDHADRYVARDGRHFFQFLGLAGRFLVWFAGTTSSVLDLTTGYGFDVPGTVSGSPDWIVTATPERADSAPYRVARLGTGVAPPIRGC
jgi:hypothetical protein